MNTLARVRQEPVLFQGVIQSLIALLIGFNLIQMTDEQFGLIMAASAAILSFITRRVVTPTGIASQPGATSSDAESAQPPAS